MGPTLLVFGLTHTDAGAASLMLNLEAVFTALLAWVIFKENADRRIVLGHAHTHEPLEYTDAHVHDAHHRHAHDFGWDGSEPRSHPHRHPDLTHKHPHFPDIHDRHGH